MNVLLRPWIRGQLQSKLFSSSILEWSFPKNLEIWFQKLVFLPRPKNKAQTHTFLLQSGNHWLMISNKSVKNTIKASWWRKCFYYSHWLMINTKWSILFWRLILFWYIQKHSLSAINAIHFTSAVHGCFLSEVL